jgi:hypothetical protein
MDIKNIAKQFVDFYYTTFDTNRGGLSSLYVRYDLADISEIKLIGCICAARHLNAVMGRDGHARSCSHN